MRDAEEARSRYGVTQEKEEACLLKARERDMQLVSGKSCLSHKADGKRRVEGPEKKKRW